MQCSITVFICHVYMVWLYMVWLCTEGGEVVYWLATPSVKQTVHVRAGIICLFRKVEFYRHAINLSCQCCQLVYQKAVPCIIISVITHVNNP